ncbi:MAG: tetratricopeptide repeat protein, partial [Chloroflexota bacterium]
DAATLNIPESIVIQNKALIYFFAARQMTIESSKNATEIICLYTKAIELEPNFAAAYNNLGLTLVKYRSQVNYNPLLNSDEYIASLSEISE